LSTFELNKYIIHIYKILVCIFVDTWLQCKLPMRNRILNIQFLTKII